MRHALLTFNYHSTTTTHLSSFLFNLIYLSTTFKKKKKENFFSPQICLYRKQRIFFRKEIFAYTLPCSLLPMRERVKERKRERISIQKGAYDYPAQWQITRLRGSSTFRGIYRNIYGNSTLSRRYSRTSSSSLYIERSRGENRRKKKRDEKLRFCIYDDECWGYLYRDGIQ